MVAAPDELFAYLDRLGIAHKTVSHAPAFTVDDARELRGQIPGGHTKNLFLRDKKGAAFLVVALEDAAVELKSLHRRLGASGRFSFGSAELMRELLGGAVRCNERHGGPRHRGARRRHDGARGAQLSPAPQYGDYDDCAGRSGHIPRSHRPPAAHRAGVGARRIAGVPASRLHSPAFFPFNRGGTGPSPSGGLKKAHPGTCCSKLNPQPRTRWSRTPPRRPSSKTSSRSPSASRCWSISGRRGAAPASSSRRSWRRRSRPPRARSSWSR